MIIYFTTLKQALQSHLESFFKIDFDIWYSMASASRTSLINASFVIICFLLLSGRITTRVCFFLLHWLDAYTGKLVLVIADLYKYLLVSRRNCPPRLYSLYHAAITCIDSKEWNTCIIHRHVSHDQCSVRNKTSIWNVFKVHSWQNWKIRWWPKNLNSYGRVNYSFLPLSPLIPK